MRWTYAELNELPGAVYDVLVEVLKHELQKGSAD